MGQLHKQLQDSTRQQLSFAKGMVEMSKSFEEAQKSALGFTKVLQNTFAFGTIAKAAGDFNKQLYDLSRQARVTGVSFGEMKRGIDEVNKSTNLSKIETASLFKAMQDNVKGIKLTTNEMSSLAKTLTTEYGASLDDVKEGLTSLLSLQQKEINVLSRVNQGFKPGELGAYAAALISVNGASEKEIETLLRVARTHGDRDKALSKEEIQLRKYQDTLQSLEKTGQDLLVKFGQPLINMFASMANGVKSFAGAVEPVLNSPWFQKLLKIGVAGGVAAAGASLVARPVVGAIRTAKDILSATGGKGGAQGGGALGGGGIFSSLIGGAKPVEVIVVGYGKGAGALGGLGEAGQAGGGIAGKAGGGILGRFGVQTAGYGGRVLKGLGIGAVAGLGGELLGAGATALGHEKVGAGLSTAGKVAGYAATGAGLGSIIPGIGNIIGGAAGALYGLYDSFDDLEKAFGTSEKAAKDAAKKVNDQAAAMGAVGATSKQMKDAFGYDDKDLWKSEQYASVKGAFGGKEYDQLSAADQKKAYDLTSDITKTERVTGTSRSDPAQLIAGATRQILAEQAAAEAGVTGKVKDELVAKTLQGLPTQIATKLASDLGNKGKVASAQAQAVGKFGAAFPDMPNPDDLAKAFDVEKQSQFIRGLQQVNAEYSQIKGYSEAIIVANDQIADTLVMIKGDVAGAAALDAQSLQVIEAKEAAFRKVADIQKSLLNGQFSEKQAQDAIKDAVKDQNISVEEKNKLLEQGLQILSGHKNVESSLAVLEREKIGRLQKAIDRDNVGIDIAKQRADLLESEMNLQKEMFMGAGASVEMQMRTVSAYKAAEKALDAQIAKEEQLFETSNHAPEVEARLIQMRQQRVGLAQKEISLTKNLREGYLQSMQAFTNVEGTFSKIILNQETGVDTLMEKFGVEGGITLGKRGAGSAAPSVRWGAGGKVQFENEKETQDRMLRFDPELFTPQAFAGDVAAATKGTPAADYLRGESVNKTLGAGSSSSSDMQKIITEPVVSGLGDLNKNMSQHVADGIRMAGGLAPIKAAVEQGNKEQQAQTKIVEGQFEITKEGGGYKVNGQKLMANQTLMGPDGKRKVLSKQDAEEIGKAINKFEHQDRKRAEAERKNKAGVGQNADDPATKKINDRRAQNAKESAEWGKRIEAFSQVISQQAHANNTNNVGQRGGPAVDNRGNKLPGAGAAAGAEPPKKQKDIFSVMADQYRKARAYGGQWAEGGGAGRAKTPAEKQAELEAMTKASGGSVLAGDALKDDLKKKDDASRAAAEAEVAKSAPKDSGLEKYNAEVSNAAYQREVQRQQARAADEKRIKEQTDKENAELERNMAGISVDYSLKAQGKTATGQEREGLIDSEVAKRKEERDRAEALRKAEQAARDAADPQKQSQKKIDDLLSIGKQKGGGKADDEEGVPTAVPSPDQMRIGLSPEEAARRQAETISGSGDMTAVGTSGGGGAPGYLKGSTEETPKESYERRQREKAAAGGSQKEVVKAVDKVRQATEKGAQTSADASYTVSDTIKKENEKAKQEAGGAPVVSAASNSFGAPSAGVGSGWKSRVIQSGIVPMNTMPNMFASMFGMADGGKVGGTGPSDRDSVAAMLAPGEYVVNARAAREHMGLLHQINNNKFAMGGPVIPSPSLARAGGGGFAPKIHLNVKGDSVQKILTSVQRELGSTLSDMMSPSGTSGRFFDLPNAG
jgi:hypothetical protein